MARKKKSSKRLVASPSPTRQGDEEANGTEPKEGNVSCRGPHTVEGGKTKSLAVITGIPPLNLEAAVENLDEEEGLILEGGNWTEVRSKRHSVSPTPPPPLLKLEAEDVQSEVEYWETAVVCHVMGANPPWEAVSGFVKRIWGKYDFDKVSFRPNGVFLVRFKSKETQQVVIKNGYYLFDNKPLIVKEWRAGMSLAKEDVGKVPIWIKLHDLGLKFWGCLPKICSLVGTFIRNDAATEERTRLGFARALVEVHVDQDFPDKISFLDDNDELVTVLVGYDWKPTICQQCKKIGHLKGQCHKQGVPRREKPRVPSEPRGVTTAPEVIPQVPNPLITPRMIHNAIVDLVGKGSLTTEGKISEYIIKKYEGLPWAHERYLKHHLDKLCGLEELIYDDIEGTYSLPEETKRKSPRRKLVKQKMLSRFKEDVVEVGNSAREELDELSDSGVGFQEGTLQQLGRKKRKRKRKHIYDEEDDEGVQASVIEPRKVFFRLNGREVENRQLEQCNSRMSDEDHELVDVSEGTSTPKLDMVCSNEVNNQVLPVNNVVSERRNEPEMSVLPPNTAELPRVVPVKSVNESNLVRDLVLAPDIEDPLASVEKSDSKEREQNLYASELMIMPYKDNPQNSVLPPNIEDPLSSVEKSNSKEREQNPFASELTIVPYKDNPENSPIGIPSFRSVDPIIICGLFIPKDEQEIKKIQVYHTRKRSKPSQGKTKALKEEPVLASLDLSMQTSPESKVKKKSQSPKLKGLPLLENDSATQLANQKSSHPIHLGNISMEDEEPLQQVIEKYGYRKKHEALGAKSEVASALSSSKAGAHLRKELPGFENSVEMTPTVEQETALRERTGKQLDLELISQHKNCDIVEDNTSRKLSSGSLDESGTKDSGKAENQRTENLGLGNAERSLLQVSDHNLQGPTATFGQATESALDWGSHRLIEGPNFHHPENPSILKETAEEFKIPSLFVELHQKGEGPSELTRRDALDNQHSKREKQHMLLLTKSDRAGNKGTSPDEDDQERPLKVKEPTPKCEGYLSDLQNHVREGLPEVAPYQHSQKLNEQLDNSQQLKRKRGRPRKSDMSIIKDEADSLVISNPTTYQFPDNQNKQGELINEQLSLKDALDPSSLHLDEQEGATLATFQQNDRVRTRKQRATQKDTTDLLDTHLKEQERHLQNQNNQLDKIGRVRTLRSKEDAFQALNLQEQRGRNSAAGCRYEQFNKVFKKDGRGKPRKKEDKAEEYGIYFKNHYKM